MTIYLVIYAGVFIFLLIFLICFMHREAAKINLETIDLTGSGGVDGGEDGDRDGGEDRVNDVDGGGGGGGDGGAESETNPKSGLRVVQLSDIHIKFNCIPPGKIISIVLGAAPDIVVLTGDYIDSPNDTGRFLTWISGLIGALEGIPVYMCYGNHDYTAFDRSPSLKRSLTRDLKKLGAHVLENRSQSFTHGGGTYAITGFSDYYAAPYYDVRKVANAAPKGVRYHIGISHNPDLALDFDIDKPAPHLVLFGHFHGGQIWMPFHLEYTCLRKERLCKIGVRKGIHAFRGRTLYISRGLGCVMFPLRLGSRPEITLLLLP